MESVNAMDSDAMSASFEAEFAQANARKPHAGHLGKQSFLAGSQGCCGGTAEPL